MNFSIFTQAMGQSFVYSFSSIHNIIGYRNYGYRDFWIAQDKIYYVANKIVCSLAHVQSTFLKPCTMQL